MIARDVYGCHYDDLSKVQKGRIAELLALRLLQNEYEKDAIDRIKNGG